MLRQAWSCVPEPIEVLDELERYVLAAIEELDRPLAERLEPPAPCSARRALDRRGESPLAVLADALASQGEVLAVCADVARRLEGLRVRIGGFSLISHHGLACDPRTAERFAHIVVLDPPATPEHAENLWAGTGFTHLAWGEAELRFAQQMHELEYGLRASLGALYRDLRSRERVAGEELERLLRGHGSPGRPARLAGRLIRVLAELELVSLDRDLPALALAGAERTSLEHSPAFRVYAKRHEDGLRFLRHENPMASSVARPR